MILAVCPLQLSQCVSLLCLSLNSFNFYGKTFDSAVPSNLVWLKPFVAQGALSSSYDVVRNTVLS